MKQLGLVFLLFGLISVSLGKSGESGSKENGSGSKENGSGSKESGSGSKEGSAEKVSLDIILSCTAGHPLSTKFELAFNKCDTTTVMPAARSNKKKKTMTKKGKAKKSGRKGGKCRKSKGKCKKSSGGTCPQSNELLDLIRAKSQSSNNFLIFKYI